MGGIGMKTIKERAKEFAQNYEIIPKGMDCEDCDTCTKCKDYRRYVDIVTEQKAIDDKEIKKLTSIMEHSASVLGIGTKWFNEDARRAAIAELKQEILNYLSD